MLTNKQINETETIYQIIDSGKIYDDLINQIRKLLHNEYFGQSVYLEWLLFRWTILRKDKQHLPKRHVSLNEAVTREQRFSFKKGDWECTNCRYHNFHKNIICRSCNSIHPCVIT